MNIYFSLPNFYSCFNINNNFAMLVKKHPEYLNSSGKNEIIIASAHGNFPYNYWHGGANNNFGKGAYYKDFVNCYHTFFASLRFNCSNIFLNEDDFFNVMNNIIFKTNHTGSNYIEVSNLKLFEYLKEEFPYYYYVLSSNANLIQEFTPNILEGFIKSNNFQLIELPYGYNLSLIKDLPKQNLELKVNSLCNPKCAYYKKCQVIEQKNSYNFSGKSIYECSNYSGYHEPYEIIPLKDIEEIFVKQGYNHYKIIDFPTKESYLFPEHYAQFLIKYFIKDEYAILTYNYLFGKEKIDG